MGRGVFCYAFLPPHPEDRWFCFEFGIAVELQRGFDPYGGELYTENMSANITFNPALLSTA
jgi:hypothetical protein